ncbi:RNA polymerase sigma factor [Paenibacillus marinisediminis]
MRSFLELYDDYYDDVYRYVRFRVGDVWDTDDIVSDIFRKSFESARKQGGTVPEYDRAWLFTIARNRIIDHYRQRKDVPYGQDPEAAGYEHIPELCAETGVAHECLQKALVALPPEDRECVQMKYMLDLSYEEISRITGKDGSWLRTRMQRVRRKLSIWIEKCLGEV